MVDSISKVPGGRENGAARNRSQVSPAFSSNGKRDGDKSPERQPEAMLEAIANLANGEASANTKIEIERDENTGAVTYRAIEVDTGRIIAQWPAELLMVLRKNVSDLEGMLLDKKV